MTKPRRPYQKHTLESLTAAARGFASISQFSKTKPHEYAMASRKGLLDKIGLPPRQPRLQEWTFERIAEVSKLYPSQKAMHKGPHQWALKIARRQGWQDALPYGDVPTDNDCFYLWLAEGEWFNGLPVYKVGITSRRSGDSRTRGVAKVGGFKRGKTLLFWVPDAMAVEGFALSLGVNPQLSKTDGYTEFRAYTPEELATVIAHATRIQSENFVPSPARI